MQKDRYEFEKEILKRKLAQNKEMSFTYAEGFDIITIRKDGIEALIFFGEEPKRFICLSKHVYKQNEEKVEEINSTYRNIHAEYQNDEIVLIMATLEKVVEQYLFGLKLLENF